MIYTFGYWQLRGIEHEKCNKSGLRKINLEITEPIALSTIVGDELIILHKDQKIKSKIDIKPKEEFEINN